MIKELKNLGKLKGLLEDIAYLEEAEELLQDFYIYNSGYSKEEKRKFMYKVQDHFECDDNE